MSFFYVYVQAHGLGQSPFYLVLFYLSISLLFSFLAYQYLYYQLKTRFQRMRTLSLLLGLAQATMFLFTFLIFSYFQYLPNRPLLAFMIDYPKLSFAMFLGKMNIIVFLTMVATITLCIYLWMHNDQHWLKKFESRRKVVYPALFVMLILLILKPGNNWNSLENYYLAETYRSLFNWESVASNIDKFTKNRVGLALKEKELPKLRPNILFFRLEETAKSQFGLYNPELGTAPFLHALLVNQPQSLFLFHNHYSHSGATDTSVVGIYTGLNPTHSGADFGHFPVMWDYANAAGYHTFAVIPYPISWSNLDRKFASKDGKLTLDYAMSSDDPNAKIAYEDVIKDHDITDYVLQHLESISDQKPFLGIVDFYFPHGRAYPISKYGYETLSCINSDKKLSDYQCALYDNDNQISIIFNKLEALGILDNTIIIGTSDHGADIAQMPPNVGSIRRVRLNNYFQEVMSIPLFIYIPKSMQAHIDKYYPNFKENLNKQTSNIDILPTVVDLIGIADHPQIQGLLQEIDGKSLLREIPDTRWIEAKNTNDFRSWEPEGFAILKDNRYKYILDDDKEFIFDLKEDSKELHNLFPPSTPDIENFYHDAINYINHNNHLRQFARKSLGKSKYFKEISATKLPNFTGIIMGDELAATVPGILSYGPYEKLRSGAYHIKINYKTPNSKKSSRVGDWDAGYFSLDEPIKLAAGPIEGVKKQGQIAFDIIVTPELNFEPFEVRTFYNGTGNIIIESIVIEEILS